MPSSGELVRPTITSPAARNRAARLLVTGARQSSCFRMGTPSYAGSSTRVQLRSFSANGTPRNGPSGSSPAASVRARSNRVVVNAWSSGSTASTRAIAASTSSAGVTSPERTSSAWAVASNSAKGSDIEWLLSSRRSPVADRPTASRFRVVRPPAAAGPRDSPRRRAVRRWVDPTRSSRAATRSPVGRTH